jgi:hypothetical protein
VHLAMRAANARRRLVTVACVLLLASGAFAAFPPHASAGMGIDYLGVATGLSADVRTVVDAASKRLIAFDNTDGSPTLRLRALAGERLSTVLERRYPANLLPYPPSYAWDEANRTLFLLTYPSAADRIAASNPHLVAIDARTLEPRTDVALNALPTPWRIRGLRYAPLLKRLYVVGQISPVQDDDGNHTVAVAAIDPQSGRSVWSSPGFVSIPSCQKLVSNQQQSAVSLDASETLLTIGCAAGRIGFATQPGVPAVASIDVSDPAHPATSIHQVAGNYVLGDDLDSGAAGRFVMVSSSIGSPTQAAYVFDRPSRSYLGVVSAGDSEIQSVGLNTANGHLYVATNQGLLVASFTGLDIPQALQFDVPGASPGAVLVVPFGGLLAIPVHTVPGDLSSPVVVKLYRDRVPPFVEPAENPDARTNDVPEIPGKTSTLFDGEASAYGMRVKEVGGLNGALQNVVPSTQNYWREVHQASNLNDGLSDGDRSFAAASIPKTRLSNDEAGSSAVSLAPDENTLSDYGTLTQGKPWTYETASCADFGSGATPGQAEDASAWCSYAHEKAGAEASFQKLTIPGVVVVGSSASSTRIDRVSGVGVRSVAQAEARDVTIGTNVFIGRVVTEVSAGAGGRPGTAKTSFVRRFENVSTPAYSCSTSCDPASVLKAVSAALGVTFRVTSPEAEIIRTPRGARASVQRDPEGQQEDMVFNDQSRVERHVPALRITAILDNSARARVIVDLAAAEVVATYGITPQEMPDVGGPPPPLVQPPSIVVRPPAPSHYTSHPGIPPLVRTLLDPSMPWRLLVGSPGILVFLMWSLFAAPLYVATRRRALLRFVRKRPS